VTAISCPDFAYSAMLLFSRAVAQTAPSSRVIKAWTEAKADTKTKDPY